MKFLKSLIEGVCWIQLMMTPVLLAGLGLFVFFMIKHITQIDTTLKFVIPILLIALILGVYWAERIRKSTGCVNFMGRLLGTPEINGQAKK